jgi:phenylacetate-CoA ligase
MFIIRGENIYPSAIDDVVMADPGYGGEHRIVISRGTAMDVLAVQVEHRPGIAADARQEWADRLSGRLRHVLGVGANVVPVQHNTLPRTDFKARRVIDDRDLLGEILRTGAGGTSP